jgi:hypothetical protein
MAIPPLLTLLPPLMSHGPLPSYLLLAPTTKITSFPSDLRVASESIPGLDTTMVGVWIEALGQCVASSLKANVAPTLLAASQLLSDPIKMKEASTLVLRKCQWAMGVPLGGDDIALPQQWCKY